MEERGVGPSSTRQPGQNHELVSKHGSGCVVSFLLARCFRALFRGFGIKCVQFCHLITERP